MYTCTYVLYIFCYSYGILSYMLSTVPISCNVLFFYSLMKRMTDDSNLSTFFLGPETFWKLKERHHYRSGCEPHVGRCPDSARCAQLSSFSLDCPNQHCFGLILLVAGIGSELAGWSVRHAFSDSCECSDCIQSEKNSGENKKKK